MSSVVSQVMVRISSIQKINIISVAFCNMGPIGGYISHDALRSQVVISPSSVPGITSNTKDTPHQVTHFFVSSWVQP